ncbi:MAG: Anti-sigma factor RskA [Candidatus Sulfotelmatobacter sp.]|nr:Anti-sigma factor RskA [Candidatus Sulfotelmatobacter sp.]
MSLTAHQQYEELCTLAALGDISEDEFEDLKKHTEECAGCKGLVRQLHETYGVLTAGSAIDDQLPEGMRRRFDQQARLRGILPPRPRGLVQQIRSAAAGKEVLISLSLACIVLSICLAAAFFELAYVRKHLSATQRQPSIPSNDYLTLVEQNQALQQQLGNSEKEREAVAEKLKIQQLQADEDSQRLYALNSRIATLVGDSTELRDRHAASQKAVAELQQTIQQLETQRDAQATASVVEEAEIRNLKQELQRATEQVEEQRRLNVATAQVRKLIEARNLHIVDIHDTDENGRQLKPFGRIFSDGKQLLFYAYDLPHPRPGEAIVAFHVWGERTGSKQSPRSLGVFQPDDVLDDRWLIRVQEPSVLSEIDQVFVTVSAKPEGKRFLSVRLDTRPNHP